MEHTPGPWKWDGATLMPQVPNLDSAVHTILSEEGMAYGYVQSDWRDTIAESDGNRRLIAAAPEMLDALLLIDIDKQAPMVRQAIHRAIYAARGE